MPLGPCVHLPVLSLTCHQSSLHTLRRQNQFNHLPNDPLLVPIEFSINFNLILYFTIFPIMTHLTHLNHLNHLLVYEYICRPDCIVHSLMVRNSCLHSILSRLHSSCIHFLSNFLIAFIFFFIICHSILFALVDWNVLSVSQFTLN